MLSPSRWRLHLYFALLLAMFVFATLAAMLVVRAETRESALDSAAADANFAATRAASDLADDLTETEQIVVATAANPAIASVLDQPDECTLSFGNVGPMTASINILAANGTVVCSSATGSATDYSGAEWLSSALTAPLTRAQVSHPDTGEPAYVIAAPIAGTEAVLAVVLDLKDAAPGLAERYSGARDLVLVLVSPDGDTVLSRSVDPDKWAGANLSGTEFGTNMMSTERRGVDGTTRIYGREIAGEAGWQVYAGADKADALAGSDRVFRRLSIAILAGLAVALGASLFVYLITIRPIRRLSTAIAEASADPMRGVTVEPGGPAEVAELAKGFNEMTRTVRHEFTQRERAVAQRDELEKQLNHMQRLESLGLLSGGIAHDFNNMLGVILSYAGFVQDEVALASAEDRARWAPVERDIEEILQAVNRAAGLTRQLLAFARADIAPASTTQPNDTISTLGALLARTLGENIALQLTLASDLSRVQIDPGKLEQVLFNLAVNARDAMPTGGQLVIDSSNIEVDEEFASTRPGLKQGSYVRLRVSDTGSGMERSVMDRAFEPLFTTKPAGRGTGLGLSTVYGIVTQAGGDVSIYSEMGRGTTFNILLPATDAPVSVAQVAAPTPRKSIHGGETVLVVEDDGALMGVATRILSGHGYRTLIAPDGASAVQLATQYEQEIDVLISDLVLPDMSGTDVAEILGRERPNLKVIYSSGYAAPALTRRAALDRRSMLLEKPFSATQLLGIVRQALDA